MLLPVRCPARRADGAGVIGQALALAAAGQRHRPIAEGLGRPAATVRGWPRRAVVRAGPLRSAFTALACGLDPDPLLPAPAGPRLADAVAAVVAAARRWGPGVSALSPGELASAVTMGALLAPGLAWSWPTRAAPGEPGRGPAPFGADDQPRTRREQEVSQAEEEQRRRAERTRGAALFRYELIHRIG